jgi:protein-S-isoprenylcysteine O-methyltransferase Ste14
MLVLACGVGILFFETIFVWATISFGLRFSNLTHRGIVTKGPYYFTRHPAYISKLCAFFLIALPWLDGRGAGQGVRNMFMLAGLSFVYWVRAKTEERNLASMDPAYAMYSETIRQRHRRWLRLQFGRPAEKR